MNVRTFRVLFNHIEPYMKKRKKRKRGKTPNGDIGPSSRLSMALRWFAGGEPIDIMQTHGVGYDEVYNSVWEIVDAINACPQLHADEIPEPSTTTRDSSWVPKEVIHPIR